MAVIYKCPSCGDSLVFKEGTENLVCNSCGTEIPVEEYKEKYLRNDAKDAEPTVGATDQYKVFKCSTCGAELMTDEHTSSTFCSYCGSPTLIEDRLSGETSPEFVIPFKYKKEDVVEKYREWASKGFFTPSGFRSSSTIEKISGVYVPFWLYDFDTRYSAALDCTIVRHESDSKYDYTYTDHYSVHRDFSAEYNKIPTDASEKMDDDTMDKLEPFDYAGLKDFEMPYLSGFLSEKYNYTSNELLGRAKERVKKYLEEEMAATLAQYTTTNFRRQDMNIVQSACKYAVMPVWMLNYRYQNQNFTFAMNGQTGKIVGTRPISKGKAIGTFVVVAAAIFGILTGIGVII